MKAYRIGIFIISALLILGINISYVGAYGTSGDADQARGYFHWMSNSSSGYYDNGGVYRSWGSSPASASLRYDGSFNSIPWNNYEAWYYEWGGSLEGPGYYVSSDGIVNRYQKTVKVYYQKKLNSISLSASPSTTAILNTNTTKIKVTANYADGTTADVTKDCQWSTSNGSVGWVADNSDGSFNAGSTVGSALIAAYYRWDYAPSKKSATITINTVADTTAPTAPTIGFSAPAGYTSGAWTNQNVTFTITPGTDIGGSGVKGTEYSTNGGATWATYTGGVTISSVGTTTVLARTVDNANNRSSNATAYINIDRTAPTATISASPSANPTNASSITYTIQFSENVTGLAVTDIAVTNGTKGTFTTVDANTYTLVVTNSGTCTQTVSIGAGVCTDGSGNGNTGASKSVTIDRTAPTVTITANPSTNPTNASSITYTIQISKNVTGLAVTDIAVTNGTKGTFAAVDANTYTLVVTNAGSCSQTISVGAGVCTDALGNGNAAASKTVTIDRTAPTITITANPSANPTNASSITYTIQFSENVTGLLATDIAVTNGAAGTFTAVDANTYTLVVTNTGNCTQTVSVGAGVCTDAVGNANTGASKSVTIDRTAPTVTIAASPSANPTNASSITYTIQFSENVTGLAVTDIAVTNGTKGTFTAVDANTYTLVVTNAGSCSQTISVGAGVCTDAAGNGNTAASKSVTIDRTAPTVTITANPSANPTNASSITYTIQFSKDVTGFLVTDIVVTNGTVGTFTAVDANTYTLAVTNAGSCSQTISVGAGVCTDVLGNGNAAASKSVTIDRTAPTVSFSPNGGTIQTTSTVTITASDTSGVNTLWYKWDSNAYTSVVGASTVVTPPSGGSHTLYAYASDNIGNVGSAVSAAFTVNIIPTITSVTVSNPIYYGQDATIDATGTNISQASYRIYYTTSPTKPSVDTSVNAATPGASWIDSGVAGSMTVNSSTAVSSIVAGANLNNFAWTYIITKVALGSSTNNWVWKYSDANSLNMNAASNPDTYIGYVGHNQIIRVNGEKIVLTDPNTPSTVYGPYNAANVNIIGNVNTFFNQDYVTYRLEFDVVNPSPIKDMKISLYSVGGIDISIENMQLQKRQVDGTFAAIKDLNSSYVRRGVGRYSVRLGNDLAGNPMIAVNGTGRYAIEYTGKIKIASFLGSAASLTENSATLGVYTIGNIYPYTLQLERADRKFYIETKVCGASVMYH